MTNIVTRWWWVRHAPVIGANGRIYGQEDLEADCSHLPLFQHLAQELPHPALWVTSHLRRTHQTADAIAKAAGRESATPRIEPLLAEQHFGDWQGLTHTELEREKSGRIHRFWHAPASERPPNGESFMDVVARVGATMDRITRDHAGSDIVAVAHGGTIRAALAIGLGIDPEQALRFEIATCSVTRIDHIAYPEAPAWRVAMVNRHAHERK